MKRLFTMIVAVCTFFAVSAQFPMVTLSHDGELSFFTSVSAFEEAVAAAVDGDVLYLSEGKFATRESTVIIEKYLSIQGTGYNSHLMGDLHFIIPNSTASSSAINIDGLRLKELIFQNADYVENAVISKCKIDEGLYNAGLAAKNVTIDRCDIDNLNCYYAENSNVVVKNSKIIKTDRNGSSVGDFISEVSVINCNIREVTTLPRVTVSSILGEGYYNNYQVSGNPALYNTLFNVGYMPTDVKTYDCYSNEVTFDDDMNCKVDLEGNGYLGEDGKIVGVMGGELPFSENPSVPTVDTSKSSVEYDASGNKLKVNITVKAD